MKKGFTLVELLVVVLIIGVLSAIALPQYTMAVEKSRMAEALQNCSSLRKAVDIYIMSNGWPESDIELVGDSSKEDGRAGILDIDIESSLICDQNGGDLCRSKYFVYDVNCSSSTCYVGVERHKDGNYENDDEYDLYWSKSKTNDTWESGFGFNGDYPYAEKLYDIFQAQKH